MENLFEESINKELRSMDQRLYDLEEKMNSIDTKLSQVVDAILGNPFISPPFDFLTLPPFLKDPSVLVISLVKGFELSLILSAAAYFFSSVAFLKSSLSFLFFSTIC